MVKGFYQLRLFTFIISFGVFSICSASFAEQGTDSDLEEAVPLGNDENLAPAQSTSNGIKENKKEEQAYRLRTYMIGDAEERLNERSIGPFGLTSTLRKDKIYSPNFEMGATLDGPLSSSFFGFADVQINRQEQTAKTTNYLNQIGLHGSMNDHIQVAVGKERNRRSPGMIISPSDFLFETNNLPGQREDRRGIWLARLSYQDMSSSIDLISLPVNREKENGLPASDSTARGFALRAFKQFEIFDLSFSMGRLDEISRAGFSIQSMIQNELKLYGELGYRESMTLTPLLTKKNTLQTLLGLSFEGSEDYTFKIEYLQNGNGLTKGEFQTSLMANSGVFLRQKYLLLNLVIPEIRKRYNVYATEIFSLEDHGQIQMVRGEYIINDQWITGLSGLSMFGGPGTQYARRQFDHQFNLDLKYSF